MNSRRSPLEQQWLYGTVRTLLISYGLAAYVFLSSRTTSGDEPQFINMAAPASGLVILGLLAQLFLLAVRLLAKRYLSDRDSATQALIVIELIGDGVTVMLFALGTFGAIFHIADNI